jgi:hypothetical protein
MPANALGFCKAADTEFLRRPVRQRANRCLLKGHPMMAYAIPQLLTMSQAQLDALFTNSPAGDIPDGEGAGTAIVAAGIPYSGEIAAFISSFAWRGKIFDAKIGIVRNKVLPFGVPAVVAEVSKGESWLDGKPCVILDYSQTSLVAHWIRDEMRLIGPGLYLGRAYWGKTHLIGFALQF